jgi:hypothetical protein
MRQFLLSFVRSAVLLLAAVPAMAQQPDPTAARPLFNGRDLNGWEGDPKWFRVQDGAIVGGNLQQKIPHNFFLATDECRDTAPQSAYSRPPRNDRLPGGSGAKLLGRVV